MSDLPSIANTVRSKAACLSLLLVTPAEKRKAWIDYGQALLLARKHFGVDDRAFGAWIKDEKLNIGRCAATNSRWAAMWLASNWETIGIEKLPPRLCNAAEIRRWWFKSRASQDVVGQCEKRPTPAQEPKGEARKEKARRHALLRKMRYPSADKAVERAIQTLDGVVLALDRIDPNQLDSDRVAQWAVELKRATTAIARFSRGLANVKANEDGLENEHGAGVGAECRPRSATEAVASMGA